MAHDSADSVGASLFIYFNESGESKHPKMIQNACTTCLLCPGDQGPGYWRGLVCHGQKEGAAFMGVYRPTTFINILLII